MSIDLSREAEHANREPILQTVHRYSWGYNWFLAANIANSSRQCDKASNDSMTDTVAIPNFSRPVTARRSHTSQSNELQLSSMRVSEHEPPADSSAKPVCEDLSGSKDASISQSTYGKESDLWLTNGDCAIHLCDKDDAQDHPCFNIHSQALLDHQCHPLLSQCVSRSTTSPHTFNETSSGSVNVNGSSLYLPAPDGLSEQDIVRWHISTRNFFAWLLRKPLVGDNLGYTLVELLNRMALFRTESADNVEDILCYADEIGYTNLANNVDNALALLFFADYCRNRKLWVAAFTHCVGMADKLTASLEYEPNSPVTKVLIRRARLEMDLHISRTTHALNSLLDVDLAMLGFTTTARSHLDYFRSTFIQPYLVSKYGYWPPSEDEFDISACRSLCFELEDLYDYLADRKSSPDSGNFGFASGGICIRQNIEAFNKRHKFSPLPFEMPLLPELNASRSRLQHQRSLTAFKRSVKDFKASKVDSYRRALLRASNRDDNTILTSPLVRAYMQFEYAFASEQEQSIDFSESRKIHWIFLYAFTQMALSVIRAPIEVEDTETTYPLCCLTDDLPNWSSRSSVQMLDTTKRTNSFGQTPSNEIEESSTPVAIQPDCDPSFNPSFSQISKTVEVLSDIRVSDQPSSTTVELPFETKSGTWDLAGDDLHSGPAAPKRAISMGLHSSHTASYGDYEQVVQRQAIQSVEALLRDLSKSPPEEPDHEFFTSLDSGSDSLPAIRWSTRFLNLTEPNDAEEFEIPELDSSSETSSFESAAANRVSVRTETTRSSQPGSEIYIQTNKGKISLRSVDLPASITKGYNASPRASSYTIPEKAERFEDGFEHTLVIGYTGNRIAEDAVGEVAESPIVPAFFTSARMSG